MTDGKIELTRRKALLGLGTVGAAGAAGVGEINRSYTASAVANDGGDDAGGFIG